MRECKRWGFAALFLAAAVAVIWFLSLFTRVEESMYYITWDSAVRLLPDGREQPFAWEAYTNEGTAEGSYRFTGSIPAGMPAGFLLFETAGADLTLSLNGAEIWHSTAPSVEAGSSMAQGKVPLEENTSGTLTVTFRLSENSGAIFPPLVRLIPDSLEVAQNTAFADRTALPAGAAAFALLLISGVFLMGIFIRKADWSLIPLMAGVGGLMVVRLCQDQRAYFLPEETAQLLGNPKADLVIAAAFLLYLAMNRQRHFWKYMGVCAGLSAAVLLICDLVSLASGGYLSKYIHGSLIPEIQAGLVTNLLYWLTLWLAFVSALISAYGIARSYAIREVQSQGLQLKNQMISESYHNLEENMKEREAFWHEFRHQLTALDCLYQERDYGSMGKLLTELLENQHAQAEIYFTQNRTVNLILQNAAFQAKKLNIHFQAQASVPENLNIPEPDLCGLLLNMLDNALEAAQKVMPPDRRRIFIQISQADLYLAVKCENIFDGELKRDKNGHLLTTKENRLSHGFGCRQMAKIAQKYGSTMYFDTAGPHLFRAQTALRIPSQPDG